MTAMLEAAGRADFDWSADYRLLSRSKWSLTEIFGLLLRPCLELFPSDAEMIVASMDDTILRKTGTHIPGVSYRRDPMSPPFQANLIRGQRFVQVSVAVPFRAGASPVRAIPAGFTHAPSAGKLSKTASAEEKAAHRKREKELSLSTYGAGAITGLRDQLDGAGKGESHLLMAVDGSYTNGQILSSLPERTHLIGRIRKDAVLHELPPQQEQDRGRPRSYSETTVTPEQVRQNESIPWQSVRVFAAGKEHDCDIKDVGPLLWRKTGPKLQLRSIVIRPLAYRRSATSRLLYRQPAYLITTDLVTPAQTLVQAYFWRWDIEVNHRDEKQLIGVGHAQVRSPLAAERAPGFAVACYSMLLIAAAQTYGLDATTPPEPRPKWLRRATAKQVRLSTKQLLSRFKTEHRSGEVHDLPNFSDFASNVAQHMKSPKGSLSLKEALDYAMN